MLTLITSWNEANPDHNWCGIRLYDETALHTERLSDFWVNASAPEEMGWSRGGLQALIPDINRLGTDALMIVTDGKIVYEWGNTTNIIRSHSLRKSLLSALYGIYVAEERIDMSKTLKQLGITDRVPLTKAEQQATVLDLLKARSGVYIPSAGESASCGRDGRRGEATNRVRFGIIITGISTFSAPSLGKKRVRIFTRPSNDALQIPPACRTSSWKGRPIATRTSTPSTPSTPF